MNPRIPICAAIAGLSLSACASPSASLPRDALLETPTAPGLAANSATTATPTAQADGVADRVATLQRG